MRNLQEGCQTVLKTFQVRKDSWPFDGASFDLRYFKLHVCRCSFLNCSSVPFPMQNLIDPYIQPMHIRSICMARPHVDRITGFGQDTVQ